MRSFSTRRSLGKSKRKSKVQAAGAGVLSQSMPNLPNSVVIKRRSLCTGSFSTQGLIALAPTDLSDTESIDSLSEDESGKLSLKKIAHQIEEAISHIPTMFIRTADLPTMRESEHRLSSTFGNDENELQEHYHRSSSRPPLPSIENDPKECWVALDDGNGNSAPLADAATQALVDTALSTAMDKEMWNSDRATTRILKAGEWDQTVFSPFDKDTTVTAPHAKGGKGENDVLVWSGTFSHSYYGCELPAIRCEAIVNMSPKGLADLLIDSNRVKEYNKMSIGRDDILVLKESDTCCTKVSVGKSKPPMLGKILQLKTLLHMQELPGGGKKGYIIVSRAVAHENESETEEDPKVIHSEMLMGVNVIRGIEGEPDRCILITLNHLKSPMIPMMLAKKLGLSAAVNFINDIRALC
eukprot:scaffold10193_cov69-Cyclotella_meneghiniana.AAC.5